MSVTNPTDLPVTSPVAPDVPATPPTVHPDTKAAMADWGWLNDEYNKGRWVEYMGEYIAVGDRRLLGHGPDPNELRERVKRESGVPPSRIVLSYIQSPDDL